MPAKTYNMSQFSALIVDGDTHAVEILSGMLRSFGLHEQTAVSTGAAAMTRLAGERNFDLVLCESDLSDMPGTEFVRHFRRRPESEMRFAPVIVLTGHTPLSNISALRDCGAHCVVKKPLSPAILFDRIVWAAESGRNFVDTEAYVGPDRRFRNVPPVDGVWRRASDLTAAVGDASEPNLSQAEIDSFLKPMKISIE